LLLQPKLGISSEDAPSAFGSPEHSVPAPFLPCPKSLYSTLPEQSGYGDKRAA